MCYHSPMHQLPARAAPKRELLLANHSFPGEYMIKAFGPGGPHFRAAVAEAAHELLGAHRVELRERATQSGNRLCVTLTLQVERVDEIEALYERIYRVDGLFLIL